MSLINRMLKDLEARGELRAAAGSEVLQGVRVADRRSRRLPLSWIVPLLAMLGLLSVWLSTRAPLALPPPTAPVMGAATKAPVCFVPPPSVAVAAPPSLPPPGVAPAPLPRPVQAPQAVATPIIVAAVSAPLPLAPARVLSPPAPPAEQHKDANATENVLPTVEERGERAWRAALLALERGDEQRGMAMLYEVLTVQPLRHQARLLLAEGLANRGDAGSAKELLATGLRLDGGAFVLRRAQTQLLANQGDSAAALTLLEERPLPPPASDPDARALLGALRQRQGDFPGAARAYREALTVRPRQGGYWLGLALALESGGSRSEALTAYAEALRGEGLGATLRTFAEERRTALGGARRP